VAERTAGAPLAAGATLRGMFLQNVQFTKEDEWDHLIGEGKGITTNFSIRAARFPNGVVGVEFGVRIEEEGILSLRVDYRVEFDINNPPADPALLERIQRDAAAKLAPVVVFPYIRETIQSLTAKAGKTPIILPIINIGAAFKPENIEFEDVEEDE
jgi:preprotein translocase subunit SecB